MQDVREDVLRGPESYFNSIDKPWIATATNPEAVERLRTFAPGVELVIPPAIEQLRAFRGGDMLSPGELPDAAYVTSARKIAVILARTRDQRGLTVLHYPTSEKGNHFDANLAAYRSSVASLVAKKYPGQPPLPVALRTQNLSDDTDAPIATVTEFYPSMSSLGKDAPADGIHQIVNLPTSLIPPLVYTLDRIHVPSKEYIEWGKQRGISISSKSWLHEKNPKCALRGQEWWKHPDPSQDDRVKELTRSTTNESVQGMYQQIFSNEDVGVLLKTMIENNLQLYPHQDGTIDDPDLAGELVVTHGTLYAGNIFIGRDPKTGLSSFTVMGGDRAQLYGLRGQMIDWLVSASAASPQQQKALIDTFLSLHPQEKEKRGLAMHVMYRSVMEAPWFASKGKIQEAENLIQLTHDILHGIDIWEGVNTPIAK